MIKLGRVKFRIKEFKTSSYDVGVKNNAQKLEKNEKHTKGVLILKLNYSNSL